MPAPRPLCALVLTATALLAGCISPLATRESFFRDARVTAQGIEAGVAASLRRAQALHATALACTAPEPPCRCALRAPRLLRAPTAPMPARTSAG